MAVVAVAVVAAAVTAATTIAHTPKIIPVQIGGQTIKCKQIKKNNIEIY